MGELDVHLGFFFPPGETISPEVSPWYSAMQSWKRGKIECSPSYYPSNVVFPDICDQRQGWGGRWWPCCFNPPLGSWNFYNSVLSLVFLGELKLGTTYVTMLICSLGLNVKK